jgi:hypothetical protein
MVIPSNIVLFQFLIKLSFEIAAGVSTEAAAIQMTHRSIETKLLLLDLFGGLLRFGMVDIATSR